MVEKKTNFEIWDITEENKEIMSFDLEDDETQKLSIRRNKATRDNVFIDISKGKIEIITPFSSHSITFVDV